MAFILPQQERPNWEQFCFYQSHFTKEECEKILELGLSLPEQVASVSPESTINEELRKTRVSWINWSLDSDWIFQKLSNAVRDANNSRYHFTLSGFFEALQFTKYEEENSHYGWHQDIGPGYFAQRKLSIVIQLSNKDDYEGGALEVFNGLTPPKEQGSVIIFPSYQQHRVTPVTKGKRYSLVAWVSGPPYA